MSYLKRFPLTALKIDKSFVRDIPDDADDAAIVNATIALAHNLRLRATAEGVDKQAQLDFLMAAGCDEVQGYLIGRPMPESEFKDWMQAQRAKRSWIPTSQTILSTAENNVVTLGHDCFGRANNLERVSWNLNRGGFRAGVICDGRCWLGHGGQHGWRVLILLIFVSGWWLRLKVAGAAGRPLGCSR